MVNILFELTAQVYIYTFSLKKYDSILKLTSDDENNEIYIFR